MQRETAKRLAKLAGEKIGHTIYVEQSIAYHINYTPYHYNERYRVTYFTSENDCEGVNFKTWTEAQVFLKQLALTGVPNV